MAAVAALLWQASVVAGTPSLHLRWQRGVKVPAAGGPVCAVLDAPVLAHAESRSGDDLRVFQQAAAGEAEVPFSLTESEAEPEDMAEATARNAQAHGSEVDFDLVMPRRLYSSVVLKLAAKDFVGRALVKAKESGKVLGSFAVFDLSGKGLARSTTLALAETAEPELHVALHLNERIASAAMVQGAEVPASREAQTLYTVVAATDAIRTTRDGVQVAEMSVPAHVPVERVRVVLDPGYEGEFKREVRVGGVRERSALKAEENVRGSIWRVSRPSVGDVPGFMAEQLVIDAVLGVTLRDAAKIEVEVTAAKDKTALPRLPIREVRLEMRQRSVCFESEPGAKYVLRYGDAELAAPVYKKMNVMAFTNGVSAATLGPESLQPGFQAGGTARHTPQQRAGLVWIVGVGGLVLLWASTHRVIRRRGGRA